MRKSDCDKCTHLDDYSVYHQNKNYCIFIKKHKAIQKKASEAKVEKVAYVMPFDTFFKDITLDNIHTYRDKIFKQEDLVSVLNPVVIKENDHDAIMEDVKEKLIQTVTGSGTIHKRDIEAAFEESKERKRQKEMKVGHEPPFSDWLYNYVFRTVGNRFIVETQKENLHDVGSGIAGEEVTEYAASTPDLVIRKEAAQQPHNIVIVSVDVSKVECITGMVAEMKTDNKNNLAIWECFRNMSATGTAMAIEYLSRGILVDKVNVYGIVVRVNEPQHTKLIQLKIDFSTGECMFIKCRKDFDFDLILNVVVSCL